MLEKMGQFFENRLDVYEEHQLNVIESAKEFYPFTARCLPMERGARVLDLGCGTGLELDEYYKLNETAEVTGIDLAPGMLKVLSDKFSRMKIKLILGSYFDIPFGKELFDAVVSVESLHHFTKDEKIPLYKKVRDALKYDGYFIITDYFSMTDDEEKKHREELLLLKNEQGITDNEFYHYDTPLTLEHEIEALNEAGFSCVNVLGKWGATCIIKAEK